jgi:Na+/H+ antiporter NhaD/arsenite permease-like protein
MVLESYISPQFIAITIFIVVYFFLATGWRSRAIAAIAGAAAMWAFGILPSINKIIGYVDMNAIGLLFGMMVLVGVLREANFFRVIGVRLANLVSCKVPLLFVLFLFMTAILSALLDNVTTVLFMVAITIDIAELLKIDPKPFIIGEIITSNIGGTATLIGDPPGIMIASATGFTFTDFLENAAPISMMTLIIIIGFLYLVYRKQIHVKAELEEIPMKIEDIVVDWRLFRFGTVMFIVTIALLFTHDMFHLSPSSVALISATVLLFLGGPKMPRILERVEWSTLIFFACLFVIVGGLEETGTMTLMATGLTNYFAGSQWIAISSVLWISSIMSGFIDNIPFVAAFIPVLRDYGTFAGGDISYLWWSLALGAGFGGSLTMIGSSANVVAIGVAEKRGVKFTFFEFMKLGAQVAILSTAIANLMLFSAYLT